MRPRLTRESTGSPPDVFGARGTVPAKSYDRAGVPDSRELTITDRRRQSRLRGGQPRDRHPERGAADVVEPDLVTELDRARLAAVLAADADLEVRPGLPSLGDGHLHQPADALAVERLERVDRQDLHLDVLE